MKFRAEILKFGENSLQWAYYIRIPDDLFRAMLTTATDKRVLCIINDSFKHYCAMMPKIDFHYILISKDILKKLKFHPGDALDIELQSPHLKYGIPVCSELEEVLLFDHEGSALFHQLGIGAQRSLIHLINKYKNPQLRMDRSLIIMRHLIDRKGKLDFKILLSNFKTGS
jgi:hypothetical protein